MSDITTPITDNKGRPDVSTMSERDMLTELVLSTRQLADALADLGQNPMVRAMAPKGLFK